MINLFREFASAIMAAIITLWVVALFLVGLACLRLIQNGHTEMFFITIGVFVFVPLISFFVITKIIARKSGFKVRDFLNLFAFFFNKRR